MGWVLDGGGQVQHRAWTVEGSSLHRQRECRSHTLCSDALERQECMLLCKLIWRKRLFARCCPQLACLPGHTCHFILCTYVLSVD